MNHTGLPDPTPIQQDVASHIQKGERRVVLQMYRGAGKTLISSIYALWRLLRDPDESILIVSASGPHSNAISTFMFKLLMELDVLEHLRPRADQRSSVLSFDVDGASPKVQPSVKSLGINSQLQGNRATLLISDDIETSINSATEVMRSKIIQQANEFESILKTDDSSNIVVLGTPQTGDSIYNRFIDRGYTFYVYPARIPENPSVYEGRLAPFIQDMVARKVKVDTITDTRFTEEDLTEREASVGRTYFKLQYQLDTTLSDADKFPLKQKDMIVYDIPIDKGPISISYGGKNINLPNIGFTGDTLKEPTYIDPSYTDYQYSVMSIDPSGRGADEMGYSVIKYLHGKIYVMAVGGLQGGYQDSNLFKLAHIAKEYDVSTIYIESNFGDGMFDQLLRPILKQVHPASIEEVRSNKQKELRIIDTIEPLLNQHKLIFDKSLIEKDIRDGLENPITLPYSFMYQITHVTRGRGSLRHDDRVDALSIALAAIVETVGVSEEDQVNEYKSSILDKELEAFIGDINHSANWMKVR